MEGGERSLKDHFHDAKAKQDELDRLDLRTGVYQETMRSILSNLQRCRELIQQLSIFSINEEAEDISTQDLQYVSGR
jgi:immunoglobulin-binding protein 1